MSSSAGWLPAWPLLRLQSGCWWGVQPSEGSIASKLTVVLRSGHSRCLLFCSVYISSSPTTLELETSFLQDSFSTDRGQGWGFSMIQVGYIYWAHWAGSSAQAVTWAITSGCKDEASLACWPPISSCVARSRLGKRKWKC